MIRAGYKEFSAPEVVAIIEYIAFYRVSFGGGFRTLIFNLTVIMKSATVPGDAHFAGTGTLIDSESLLPKAGSADKV
jgi:hypothetical protein